MLKITLATLIFVLANMEFLRHIFMIRYTQSSDEHLLQFVCFKKMPYLKLKLNKVTSSRKRYRHFYLLA